MAETYKQFIKHAQRQQRAYIREEAKRMDKAERLWRRYKDAMAKLGLHPLNSMEINDRRRELATMLSNVEQTHGDGPVMRYAYERSREGNTNG